MTFVLSLFFIANLSFSTEIHDFESYKKLHTYKPYVGTYYNQKTAEFGSMSVEDDKLKFFYSAYGLSFYIFNIPLNLESVKSSYSTEDFYNGIDQISYFKKNSNISKIRITENEFRLIVELVHISLKSPGELEITHSRKYFIKKEYNRGPWVLDTSNSVAVNDSFERTYHFMKTSSVPITEEQITEIRSSNLKPLVANQCGMYLNAVSN